MGVGLRAGPFFFAGNLYSSHSIRHDRFAWGLGIEEVSVVRTGSVKLMLPLFAGAAFLFPAAGLAQGRATADIIDGQGQAKGKATLVQAKDGIHVEVDGVGLPAGVHAVHIHAVGTCTGPDFTSAGGHWNPELKQHGRDNPQGAHMGDMPNMEVAADGTGKLKTIIKGAMLSGGKEPLLDSDGAAVVVHATADDYKTDPAGNAGARLACGIIKAE
jgi:Cu-Zn family superoxide dismutase